MLAIRIHPDLKARLDRAASKSRPRHSLAQEVGNRLDRSFEQSKDAWGDDSIRRLALLLAGVVYWTQQISGRSWKDDPWTFQGVVAGINYLLPILAPAGDAAPPPHIAAMLATLGDQVAADHPMRWSLTDPVAAGQRAALQVAAYIHGEKRAHGDLFIDDIRTVSAGLGIEPKPDVFNQMIAALSSKPSSKESKS